MRSNDAMNPQDPDEALRAPGSFRKRISVETPRLRKPSRSRKARTVVHQKVQGVVCSVIFGVCLNPSAKDRRSS